MADLRDSQGHPLPDCIEWVESSGPVAPRFQYQFRLILKAELGEARVTSDRRDSSGTTTRTGILTQDRYQALGRQLGILLPLGTHLDLVGELRTRKGISFNFVTISYAAGESRLEYLLSQLDEAEGNPTARAVVNLLKSIDLI